MKLVEIIFGNKFFIDVISGRMRFFVFGKKYDFK